MIKQLAHICIHTEDLEATERFYTKALGMTKGFKFVRKDRPFGYYLKFGNDTFLEVFEGKPGEVGNINHLAIEVDDIDATIDQIREAGGEVGDKKIGADHSWQAWLNDPNGIRIELHEYTEESMQLRGGTCVVDW
jgi:catechol 2,3-dioxygenase-like lactoylglutathione lyase family enzyme